MTQQSDNAAGNGATQAQPEAAPQSLSEAMAAMSPGQLRKLRLAKLGGAHIVVWLLAMGLFAAADSWRMLSDLGLASFFAVLSGALAGIVTANILHEWGHLLGARRSGGEYDIPDRLGLFVYDWNFSSNTPAQFLTMSKAGTVGGVVALVLAWWLVPADTLARAALLAGVVASFAFGARIEWPILRSVGAGGDPLTELSRIDQQVLTNSFLISLAVGLVTLWMLAP